MSSYNSNGQELTFFGLLLILIAILFFRLEIGILGLIMVGSGLIINRKFRERESFLTKGGGPIHSARIWKKGNEQGLYLTTCEIIVSINQESKATGNVGYSIVPAKHVTCSECNIKTGKAILDAVANRRDDPIVGL
ncbi:hypothetical protein EU528_10195 [Candidatus Thorarchaeota archaeon]|nr:MAG: hypothetical protein EU528_10195 [Candidatus Thorarchaeota archaeon]